MIPYKRPPEPAITQEIRQPIDLVLDGSEGDEAIVIDGLRLYASQGGIEPLQQVFYRLCNLRDEVVARRGWEQDVKRIE